MIKLISSRRPRLSWLWWRSLHNSDNVVREVAEQSMDSLHSESPCISVHSYNHLTCQLNLSGAMGDAPQTIKWYGFPLKTVCEIRLEIIGIIRRDVNNHWFHNLKPRPRTWLSLPRTIIPRTYIPVTQCRLLLSWRMAVCVTYCSVLSCSVLMI